MFEKQYTFRIKKKKTCLGEAQKKLQTLKPAFKPNNFMPSIYRINP